MKLSRIVSVGIVVAAIVWIGSGYFLPHESTESTAAISSQTAADKPFRVSVIEAQVAPHSRKLVLSGRTEADKKVNIAARTNGIITELRVRRGDHVKKGDVIAILSDEARDAQVNYNLQISRQTYYRYRRRFAAEGLDGLVPRSRRPATSPTLTGPGMVEQVQIRARKELFRGGLGQRGDLGALSITERRHAGPAVGSDGAPGSRPCRVGRARTAEKATLVPPAFPVPGDRRLLADRLVREYNLAGGAVVVVFELLDDHSRYQVGNLAWPAEDTIGAWKCLSTAINHYGRPG